MGRKGMWEILQYEFMRNALLAGLLASIACGIIGTLIVVKRIVFISGGVSHAAFGGVGLGYLIGIDPILSALIFTIASALSMGTLCRRTKIREDTAIGIMWATGMALGILFISLRPGYAADLFSYLFGSILTVSRFDLLMTCILDVVVVVTVWLLYKEFLAISFDEEFATVVGVPVERLYLTLLTLIALTVVILIRIVGVILVIALLTVPAAISGQVSHKLDFMMILSTILSAILTMSGLLLSYILNIASGAAIVLASAAAFAIFSALKRLKTL